MNLGTIVGLLVGLALMGLAAFQGAKGVGVPISSLYDTVSILIVFGGSLAATAIAFKLSQVLHLFKLLKTYGQIDIVIQFLFLIFLGFIGFSMAFESARTTIKKYKTTSTIRKKLHQHSWIHGLPLKMRFHRSKLYISAIPPVIIGFLVGVLSAMMGVGGGFIMIPAMVYILGMSTNVVVGTSLFQIIFVTTNSTFFQSYLNQNVDIVLSALMILGGVIGAQIGASVGSKLKAEYLRGILAILVLIVCAKLLIDLALKPNDLFTTSIL